jgi:hypothetical protein
MARCSSPRDKGFPVLDHKVIGADVAGVPNAHQPSLERRRRRRSGSESREQEERGNVRCGARESQISRCAGRHTHIGTAYEFVFLRASRDQFDEVFTTE